MLLLNPTAYGVCKIGLKEYLYFSFEQTQMRLKRKIDVGRPVSDISWSPLEHFLLASTSLDGSIHVWDIR
jgi:WD40 repeat protein